VLLYHIRILEDVGEFNEALNLLDVSAKSRAIVDRVSIMEYRGMVFIKLVTWFTKHKWHLARLLSKLGQADDAEHTWRALIDQNPDHYGYYKGFFSNHGIDLGLSALLSLVYTYSDM
jgi:N-alpha-acetyltransferase 15/16, NatA auxiliary subunit